MGVVLQHKSEVTQGLLGILGLCHGAEHHHVHGLELVRIPDVIQDRRSVGGLELLKMGVLNVCLSQHFAESGGLFLRRSLMYTVHEGHLLLSCQLCGGLVCGEHELLDDALGLASLTGHNVAAGAVLADDQLALGGLKLGSMAAFFLLDEYICQFVYEGDLIYHG